MLGGGDGRDQKYPRVGRWVLGGDHQISCGFSGRGFYPRGCFLFRLPSRRFSCCCRFRFRLLRPGRLPGGGHFGLPGHLRDRLRSGFWIGVWGWSGDLENTPPRATWFHPWTWKAAFFIPNSAGRLALPLEILLSWQAWPA